MMSRQIRILLLSMSTQDYRGQTDTGGKKNKTKHNMRKMGCLADSWEEHRTSRFETFSLFPLVLRPLNLWVCICEETVF